MITAKTILIQSIIAGIFFPAIIDWILLARECNGSRSGIGINLNQIDTTGESLFTAIILTSFIASDFGSILVNDSCAESRKDIIPATFHRIELEEKAISDSIAIVWLKEQGGAVMAAAIACKHEIILRVGPVEI